MQADMMEPDSQRQGAAKVGAELREMRERLGWKLADIAAELRIRLPYLEAIEQGELSALPGAAYQTGFVRAYSQTLGLDPDEILRRFRAAGMGVERKAELSFLAPVPDRAVPTGAIVLLGVILLLSAYGFWYRHTEHERELASAIPSVPAELAPLAVPKPAPPPPPVVKPAAPAAALAAAAVPVAPPAAAAPAAQTPPTIPAATPEPPGQAILATADAWVEVADSTGNILFSRVLHAGESWPVPALPGLTMTTGNAGGTEIIANGKPGLALGSAGAVMKNIQLTAPVPAVATAPPTAPLPKPPATPN